MTFSSFRRKFPEVSGYCYCADSQGRELAETGELALLGQSEGRECASLAPECKAKIAISGGHPPPYQPAVGMEEDGGLSEISSTVL